MRYVPVSCLKEGMIVAKSIYNTEDQLLAKLGTVLKHTYIERIHQLGYQGVYIEDDLSDGIIIKDIVGEELRRKSVHSIKSVFESIEYNRDIQKNKITQGLENAKKIIDNILYDILDTKDAIINMIDIKAFDEYTFYHSVNVAILAMVVGAELKLTEKELFNLGLAAILHDIGKVYISKDILLKNDRLLPEEFAEIKTHSEKGYKHLKSTYEIPTSAYIGVLQHHERYDGRGYPLSKSRDGISLFGRIICVADVYDAITSNRPYRSAMLPSEAMEYIMANSGSMFDGKIVQVFINKVAAYPVGMSVHLSNGCKALVIDNNYGAPLRPVVKVYENARGEELVEPYILDLSDMITTKNITIVEIVKNLQKTVG